MMLVMFGELFDRGDRGAGKVVAFGGGGVLLYLSLRLVYGLM